MNKKILFVSSLLLMASMLLSACGTPAKPPAGQATAPAATAAPTAAVASTKPITLTMWYWGEQEAPGMNNFMTSAVQTYEKAHPNITIKAVAQETDSLYPAFRAAAAAKQGPDIQYFWGGVQALQDVWLGNVAPISDYWSADELNNIPAGQRAETYWDGKQWGVPFYQIGTFWSYNKQLFAKAGLDPENPPETWDAMLTACDKLNAIGVAPIGIGFKDGWWGGYMVSYLGQQNFNSAQDLIAAVKGDKSLTDPMYSEWWSRWKELVDHKCFNDDQMSLDLYQGQALFEQGKAAMTGAVQSYIAQLERKMGKDVVGVMRTPVYGTGKFKNAIGVPAQVLAITSFSTHKAEAADFLRFLHSDAMMKLMYDTAGAVTPDLRFKVEWFNTNSDTTINKWMQEYPLFWYQYYYPPVWETEGSIALGQLLVTGSITPEQAATKWQDVAVKDRQQNPGELTDYAKWVLPPDMLSK